MTQPPPPIPAALGPDPEGHAWSWRALPAAARPDFGVYVHDDPDALLDALATAELLLALACHRSRGKHFLLGQLL